MSTERTPLTRDTVMAEEDELRVSHYKTEDKCVWLLWSSVVSSIFFEPSLFFV